MGFTPPTPVERQSDLAGFESGESGIDAWVRRHAYSNHVKRFSSVFITKDDDDELAGFYTLSACTVERSEGGKRWSGGPREIPVILIGKLAVAAKYQGVGLGASLLQNAVRRSMEASASVAAAAILVHSKEDGVVPFYEKFGFQLLGDSQRSLVLPLGRFAPKPT